MSKVKKSFFSTECLVSLSAMGDALYVIGGKWKLMIILAMSGPARRFNELQRKIPGISARVLSNELKELELNGFVIRKVHADRTPVLVEYEITDYACTLKDVIRSLREWGVMHRKKIKHDLKQAHGV
jgi:DNA-binding HxlR family transcriptional regulator